MGKSKLNIEDLYREQFDGFSVEPSRAVWGAMQQKLFRKQFFSFNLNSFNLYYLVTGLAIPAALAAVFLTGEPEQPVYFYNYSRNADYFEWDFGDSNTSSLSDPSHYYEEYGSYDIRLKAWNANQCYDSVTVYNAFSDQGYSIVFPTAFAPNPNGPTGGAYTDNGTSNEVFHPRVNGVVIEYQLKIFSQYGRLLFETNDINIGWDGYFLDELASQDVYIWKARGKFENGKSFVQSGDITLIRQK